MSQGSKFRKAIEASAPQPLQIPGTINAYTALMPSASDIRRSICLVVVLQMHPMAYPT